MKLGPPAPLPCGRGRAVINKRRGAADWKDKIPLLAKGDDKEWHRRGRAKAHLLRSPSDRTRSHAGRTCQTPVPGLEDGRNPQSYGRSGPYDPPYLSQQDCGGLWQLSSAVAPYEAHQNRLSWGQALRTSTYDWRGCQRHTPQRPCGRFSQESGASFERARSNTLQGEGSLLAYLQRWHSIRGHQGDLPRANTHHVDESQQKGV